MPIDHLPATRRRLKAASTRELHVFYGLLSVANRLGKDKRPQDHASCVGEPPRWPPLARRADPSSTARRLPWAGVPPPRLGAARMLLARCSSQPPDTVTYTPYRRHNRRPAHLSDGRRSFGACGRSTRQCLRAHSDGAGGRVGSGQRHGHTEPGAKESLSWRVSLWDASWRGRPARRRCHRRACCGSDCLGRAAPPARDPAR